jgi:hypothetical protein
MLDRVCLYRGEMRTSMIVVVLVTHALALAGSRGGLLRRPRPQPLSVGGISGKVLDSGGRPVAGAAVLVQTQATGIPLERGSGLPAIYRGIRLGPGEYLSVPTDADGRFVFEKIPVGSYRVVAQSWRNKTGVKALGEVEGEEIELRGVANDVVVTEGHTAEATLRPLGTGILRMDQHVPNDETFVILSTAPTGADPVLGFAGWTASFLRQAIGANRMPGGRTVVYGLPEGTVYLAMFAADDVPGFLDAKVQIQAGQTAILPFTPFVAGWSDGRHDPPPELVPIYEEIKAMSRAEGEAWYAKFDAQARAHMDVQGDQPPPLDMEVVLPSGRKATFVQVMAAIRYIQLQNSVARRADRASTARPSPSQPAPPKPDAAPSELQRLIDAAPPGATVTVPKGTHTVPVQVTKPLALKGSSPEDCTLEMTANGPALFINAGDKGEVSVEGLTIKWQLADGIKGVEQPVALAVKDTNAAIRNCRFVSLGNTPPAPMAIRTEGRSKATVSGCRFEGFDYVINFGPGTEGLVEECILRDGGHQGVTGFDRSTLRVERTIVAGFRYHGLRCTGGTLHVKDCLLLNNRVSGIYLGNKDGQGTITNTLMLRNGAGVAAFYQAKFQIHNNVILDSAGAGIGMWDTCRLQIADNIFQGNAKALAVYPKGGKDNYVIGANTFWRNTADTENCRRADDSILADPLFQDSGAGDYSLKPGPTLDRKQGLTDPTALRRLWEWWKAESKSPVRP